MALLPTSGQFQTNVVLFCTEGTNKPATGTQVVVITCMLKIIVYLPTQNLPSMVLYAGYLHRGHAWVQLFQIFLANPALMQMYFTCPSYLIVWSWMLNAIKDLKNIIKLHCRLIYMLLCKVFVQKCYVISDVSFLFISDIYYTRHNKIVGAERPQNRLLRLSPACIPSKL